MGFKEREKRAKFGINKIKNKNTLYPSFSLLPISFMDCKLSPMPHFSCLGGMMSFSGG